MLVNCKGILVTTKSLDLFVGRKTTIVTQDFAWLEITTLATLLSADKRPFPKVSNIKI